MFGLFLRVEQSLKILGSKSWAKYESNGDKNKTLLIKRHLDKIKRYLKYFTNTLKKSDTWKIQLTIATNFVSSKDTDEERVMR